MPMSMLEAMSVGVPVVASAVGEIPSILNGQGAGFVNEISEDPQAFACSLLSLRNTATRRQMGESARMIVVSRFPEKAMIQKYAEVFEELV